MPAFKSAHSYKRFAREVTSSTRYVRASEADDFLQTLLGEARTRLDVIPAGSILWRAQLGHDWEALHEGQQYVADVPCPLPPERMKPLRDRAREGRANPKGIPCLYVSTHRETALAEVRPWLRSLVSVGQFKTPRELKFVNCTEDGKRTRVFMAGTPPEHWDTAVWLDIDEAFSRPVTLSDEFADYVPTQIIAELFKIHGFDGVAYRSALGSGHNIVLFDIEVAVLINCFLYEAKGLSFDFQESANPYFIREHHEKPKDAEPRHPADGAPRRD